MDTEKEGTWSVVELSMGNQWPYLAGFVFGFFRTSSRLLNSIKDDTES